MRIKIILLDQNLSETTKDAKKYERHRDKAPNQQQIVLKFAKIKSTKGQRITN